MSSQPRVTLVIAGSYREFLNWCHDNLKSPYDRYIRYVSTMHQLYGYKPGNVRIVKVGQWYEGPLFRGRAGHGDDLQIVDDTIAMYEAYQ